jgi:hypothetical protein
LSAAFESSCGVHGFALLPYKSPNGTQYDVQCVPAPDDASLVAWGLSLDEVLKWTRKHCRPMNKAAYNKAVWARIVVSRLCGTKAPKGSS